ncbi:hypothetical protein DSO57_1013193 [Entomophthora muscae]|uniref:Uncharacterized protein n=1 Tax=Entomophthora muscae TaxID=34485 RepID=A0ACC2RKQ6_9FUNG|nr:hypothetical protein DSO57_1013193 [Entomophthora muscae]
MSRLPSIRELFSESFLLTNGIHFHTPNQTSTSPKSTDYTPVYFTQNPQYHHRMSQYQRVILENVFHATRFPSNKTRHCLAIHLNLLPRKIQIWFQNKRQKIRIIK